MDALPNELLLLIFEHLNIKDICLCRSVCKRFLLLCDAAQISELQISNAIENRKYFWFPSRKQFNHKDAIDVPRFTRCRSIFRLNECLKRLHFTGYPSKFEQLNLNDLTQLEELRIDLKFSIEKEMHLSLPNLKVLEICGQCELNFYLTTPKLKMLKCNWLKNIHLADCSTVDHLEVNAFTDEVRLLNNVQLLKAGDLLLRYECLDIVSFFPKLTTLVCDASDYEYNAARKDCLHHLVAQKLKKPELKIYFESVELIDNGKLDEYQPRKSLAFQISNYDLLLESSCPHKQIDYNELMRLVGGVIPDDFYKKYFNIEDVRILGEVESQSHLVQFLKRLDYLSELNLETTGLDQSFLDDLHKIGQLTSLAVAKSPMSTVNYDFLFKLKLLVRFSTRNDVDLFDLAFELFRKMKYFESISFYFKGDHVRINTTISRHSGEKKYVLICSRKTHVFDFNQLTNRVHMYKIERLNSRNKKYLY